MSSEAVEDKKQSSLTRPNRVWLLFGLLALVGGFVIMTVAGSGDGVSEAATQREDSVPFVETARVEAAGQTYEVRVPGRLQPRETLQLVGEVSGKVTAINPDLELGGRIGKGETILQIDDGDLQADLARANAQVATAEARLQQASAERDRQVRLAEIGAAPEKAAEAAVAAFEDAQAALEQAEAQRVIARRAVSKSVVTAPFDAIVTGEDVSLGTFVAPGQPLATLISAGAGEIRAGLPAEDVSAVRSAMRASEGDLQVVAVPNSSSLGTLELQGHIGEFSPVIDQASRTATVVAIFPDAFIEGHDGDVFSDDFMDVVIRGRSDRPIWRLPEGAVRQDSFVWVVSDAGEVRRIDVDAIDRTGSSVLAHSDSLSGDERVMVTVLAEEIEGMRVRVEENEP